MTVNTIASIAATLSRTPGSTTAKAASVFNSLFATGAQRQKQDSTDFSAAIALQNQVAQFRVASQNIAQSASLLAAAEQGAGAITTDLVRLKDIAVRASAAGLSDDERAALVAEFRALRARIDGVARSTKFHDEALLDGSSPQLRVAQENKDIRDLSIGDLTEEALFKGKQVDIASPAAAKAAEAAIKEAISYANKQLDNIRALQEGLDFASSTLQSAIQNQDAARSTLDETDFIASLLGNNNPIAADTSSLLVQTNRLPTNLLSLLNE